LTSFSQSPSLILDRIGSGDYLEPRHDPPKTR